MKSPKFYLIQSNLSLTDIARVRHALSIAPADGTIVMNNEDADQAGRVTEAPVLSLGDQILAVVGHFDNPLAVIDEDGAIQTLVEGTVN